ncbi:hypothetical protein HanRHA438_Chr17g0801261 [Helianthus annuus]|nr:hypothetical protein HanRHA438_Chr17g0801261 [Helianthus annuus]
MLQSNPPEEQFSDSSIDSLEDFHLFKEASSSLLKLSCSSVSWTYRSIAI